MKFAAGIFATVASTALAVNLDGTISVQSELGRNLMSKARALNNNNNNNNNYYSWIKDYSIKFDGCAAVPQFEREEGLRAMMLAKFKLCPSDKCNSCPNAGEYIVDMREFVEAYQQAQMDAHEYECEVAEQNCEYACQNGQYEYQNNNAANGDDYYANYGNQNNNNSNDDEEYCIYQCMSDQGLGYCQQEGGEQQDLKDFGECRPLNEDNNNNGGYYGNNYNYQTYYMGAYCTSSGVYAGVFTDSACTTHAPSGTYEKYSNGYSLPSEPLVTTGCLECKVTYNNNNNGNDNNGNNNNNNYNDANGNQILEVCEQLYEQSGKCEKKVKSTNYQDTSGCQMIHSVVPRLNSAFKSISGGPQWSKIFAWTFGLGFVALSGYVYLLHTRVIRQKVDLAALGLDGKVEGGALA